LIFFVKNQNKGWGTASPKGQISPKFAIKKAQPLKVGCARYERRS